MRQLIQDRRDVWNLTPEDAAAVEVQSVSRTGLRTARVTQSVDGVEVFNSDVTVVLDADNLRSRALRGRRRARRDSSDLNRPRQYPKGAQ